MLCAVAGEDEGDSVLEAQAARKYAGAPGVRLEGGPSGAHTHSVLSLPCK